MPAKLKGNYKGNRRKVPAPVIVIFECPGCGFRTQAAKPEKAEQEYVIHLGNVHHGLLECVFCDAGIDRGIRWLPDFATLAAHVHWFHAGQKLKDGRTIAEIEEGALPPKAFK
jgi:hypothetical protein